MSLYEAKSALEEIIKLNGKPLTTEPCEVLSYDEPTCSIAAKSILSGAVFPNVKLSLFEEDLYKDDETPVNQGVITIPSIGSTVLVTKMNLNDAFVSQVENVEKILITSTNAEITLNDDTEASTPEPSIELNVYNNNSNSREIVASILMEPDLITFNDGANEGMVNVIDLTTKLNNLEKDINKLRADIAAWVPVPQDGGLALQTALLLPEPPDFPAGWLGNTLTETTQSDIEDDKIIH